MWCAREGEQGHSIGNRRSGRGGVAGESPAWAASGRAWASRRGDAGLGSTPGRRAAWAGLRGNAGLGGAPRRRRPGGDGIAALRGCEDGRVTRMRDARMGRRRCEDARTAALRGCEFLEIGVARF